MRAITIVCIVGSVFMGAPVMAPSLHAQTVDKKISTVSEAKKIATAQKAAIYQLSDNPDGTEALQVTARPLTTDPAANFLVQVFASPGKDSVDPKPELVGSFSFFSTPIGQSQTFILPKPAFSAGSSKEMTLSIKLVAANPNRGLKDTAVEILDARMVN